MNQRASRQISLGLRSGTSAAESCDAGRGCFHCSTICARAATLNPIEGSHHHRGGLGSRRYCRPSLRPRCPNCAERTYETPDRSCFPQLQAATRHLWLLVRPTSLASSQGLRDGAGLGCRQALTAAAAAQPYCCAGSSHGSPPGCSSHAHSETDAGTRRTSYTS